MPTISNSDQCQTKHSLDGESSRTNKQSKLLVAGSQAFARTVCTLLAHALTVSDIAAAQCNPEKTRRWSSLVERKLNYIEVLHSLSLFCSSSLSLSSLRGPKGRGRKKVMGKGLTAPFRDWIKRQSSIPRLGFLLKDISKLLKATERTCNLQLYGTGISSVQRF
jgi:hypothetical protein